jgi:hypothetical protein
MGLDGWERALAGIEGLDEILASLDVAVRDGVYMFATVPSGSAIMATAAATIVEEEAVTAVVRTEDAVRSGIPVDAEFAWLTLTVHSSLESVGLTATFSAALARLGISCNVLAGYYHDHLLVPFADRDRAVDALRSLRKQRRTEQELT